MNAVRILGADPGLLRTGLGVVEARGGHCVFVGTTAVLPPANRPLAERLAVICAATQHFIAQQQPDVMVVEKLIYVRNAKVALMLGHARGALLLAAARSGLTVVDYTPREVKLAVSGNGAASKQQVQRMVQSILALDTPPTPEDVADALALAICHAHRQGH